MGLLEDYNRKGEVFIPLHTNEIQECYDITKGLYRFAMFMTSQSEVPFKHITLYNKGIKVGWFFCPLVSENAASWHTYSFYKFDVMKYVPKILNNIAQDSKFHLKKELKSMFDEFGELIVSAGLDLEQTSEEIKELRRNIAHGYSYYYDFKDDRRIQYLMYLLDDLIKCMSLKQIGFSKEEISNYIVR